MSDEIRQDGFEEQSEVPADVQDAAPQSRRQAEASDLSPQPRKGFWGKVDEWFGITRSGSNYRTEIVAGLTTFMAMVYILMVNCGYVPGRNHGQRRPLRRSVHSYGNRRDSGYPFNGVPRQNAACARLRVWESTRSSCIPCSMLQRG